MAKETPDPVLREERFGGQVSATAGLIHGGEQTLPRSGALTYRKCREIRRDPTVALARALSKVVILAGEWSVGTDGEVPDEITGFIAGELRRRYHEIVDTALSGGIDYGWQGWELVVDHASPRAGEPARYIFSKVKPLLQDLTYILVDADTGEFRGFEQGSVRIGPEKSMLVSFRVEGGNWYGESLYENVAAAHEKWHEAERGAARYDTKLAGSHAVVKYPIGKSPFSGEAAVDNGVIAQAILKSLEASGSVALPKPDPEYARDGDAELHRWDVDFLEDRGGRQPTFIERLAYLDKLKARGMLTPERAFLEGQFGTKAEASAHGDLLVMLAETDAQYITRRVNEQLVDRLLRWNFGAEYVGRVWLDMSPLTDELRQMLKGVYMAVLSNPTGFPDEFPTLDTDAIKDHLGIPKIADVAQAGDFPKGAEGDALKLLNPEDD